MWRRVPQSGAESSHALGEPCGLTTGQSVNARGPTVQAADDAELDALNKAILESEQNGGEAFLTQAVLGGKFCQRATVLHHATTEDDIAALLENVRCAGEGIIGESSLSIG
jgi:hypothetical protein